MLNRFSHTLRRFATRPPLTDTSPTLQDFLRAAAPQATPLLPVGGDAPVGHDGGAISFAALQAPPVAKRALVETWGCQMNVSDTEIVRAVLQRAGYEMVEDVEDASVVLVNTCAIRENAESKVWHRLSELRAAKRKRKRESLTVGVLGCMAERLKHRLLESDRMVDLVAGPDAYRDLPNLLDAVSGGDQAINVQLSVDETYADIAPVRTDGNGVSAFVSIMRGCNNMCSYCIVPWTRGRERSRGLGSIVDEVKALQDDGYRDVVLLGQNVNSYHDKSTVVHSNDVYSATPGFSNLYRTRDGLGARFIDLLDAVSAAAPLVRFRFTSPHPKDFPDDLLHLIAERPNIANHVHMPAQSGSTSVLKAMRRGYSREAYLDLADRIRDIIPGVTISSDFISGFCGETEADHEDTLSLMNYVQFDQAFMFAYSMRERTHAHRKLVDDVPEDVKKRRLQEVIEVFLKGAAARHAAEVGQRHLVLLESRSRRSTEDAPSFTGRTHNNKRCVVVDTAGELAPGQFVEVDVVSATSASLVAEVAGPASSIPEFHGVGLEAATRSAVGKAPPRLHAL